MLVGHVDERADADAGRVHGRHEVGDALVLRRVGVGAGEEEAPVRFVRIRGPDLGAVDDVVVAVLDRARLEGGEVGAGVGLGIALAPDDVAGGDAGEELLLLLFVAVDDHGRAGVGHADEARVGRAVVRELFREHYLLHVAHPLSAVFPRPRRRDPTLSGELLREVAREVPALFGQLERVVVPLGWQFGAEEGADLRAERFFFVGKSVVHVGLLFGHRLSQMGHGY